MFFRRFARNLGVHLIAAALTLSAASIAVAQQRSPSGEAAVLANGWGLLARGDATGAAAIAVQQLTRDPQSAAALVLLVDAEIQRSGAPAALDAYEKWVGTRRLDDAHVLRRIARALLQDIARKQANPKARVNALSALAADGDVEAAARLEEGSAAAQFVETRSLAALGNERAVERLIQQLAAMPGSKTALIDALGDSGSRKAIPPLRALLKDPNDTNRASAADALGRLGATDAINDLRPLLNDPSFPVKVEAAGALLRLNDSSGLGFLMQIAASEHAAIRLVAARELSARPDASWQSLVRSLTSDSDPVVRLGAARLIAPYDTTLANNVLDDLMRSDNVGVREAASDALAEGVASDFKTLRRLLRSADLLAQVNAAARILEITRA
jgi:HEAT repeat protein